MDIFALISFVLVTTFTPGPNNISSASMGILYGYKKALKYMLGIATGFFLIMLLCGLISATLTRWLPAFEGILRIIGTLYILWLAYHTLKASYNFMENEQDLLGFTKGFLLQVLNPKVIIYGLTLYSTFLVGVADQPLILVLSALAFASTALCSISTWALFGVSIRTLLNRPKINLIFNIVLSLLLVYSAIELSGIVFLITAH